MSRYTYDDAELRPFGAAILRLLNSGEDDVAIARRLSMAATFDLTGRPQLKGNIPISILAEKALKILGGRDRYRPEDVGRIRKCADELGLLNQIKSNPMKIIAERKYQTWAGWRKAAKEAGATRFEGDKDIAQAFAGGPSYEDSIAIGEWDGAEGSIYVYEGARRNPASKIRVGDEVIGIMGVDGGYAGTVTGVTRDSRGRVLVTYRDAESGEERVTFDFNLSKNVPARGTFPRHNPLRRRPGESERVVYEGARLNPASKIRVGDEVIGIMGVDGGYAGTVTGVTRDSRGRVLVTYRDAESGEERATFDFNLSKNVPARGTFPRHNPLRRRPGESERDFMARCMSAEKKKFPRQDQRVAVCLSKARRNPLDSGADIPNANRTNRGAAKMT